MGRTSARRLLVVGLPAVAAAVMAAGLLGGCGSDPGHDVSVVADTPAASSHPAYARASSGTLRLSEGWVSDAGMSGMTGMSSATGGQLAAYATLRNDGAIGERLVSVSSPQARDVELHATTDDGSAETMRRVDGVALPAGGSARFVIGGYHVMLSGLRGHPTAGDHIELVWTFASGTVLRAWFPVIDPEDRPGL